MCVCASVVSGLGLGRGGSVMALELGGLADAAQQVVVNNEANTFVIC